MFYKLAAFASAVSALSLSAECDKHTLVGEIIHPDIEVTKFEMNICLEEDGTLVSGGFELKNESGLECSIEDKDDEDGFTLHCDDEDVEGKITSFSEDGIAGELSIDGDTAFFTARPKF